MDDDLDRAMRLLIDENVRLFRFYYRLGDGRGGSLVDLVAERLGIDSPMKNISLRVKISQELRTGVYERDDYACRHCGVRRDLTLDHIRPLYFGGVTAMENLQTLCRPCNSRKGTSCDTQSA